MTNAIKIKAIIKHCKLEGAPVVYFKSGRRFFKLTSSKALRLTSYQCIAQLVSSWNAESVIDVVYEDEQVLLKGKPIFLSNTIMKAPECVYEKLGIPQ